MLLLLLTLPSFTLMLLLLSAFSLFSPLPAPFPLPPSTSPPLTALAP